MTRPLEFEELWESRRLLAAVAQERAERERAPFEQQIAALNRRGWRIDREPIPLAERLLGEQVRLEAPSLPQLLRLIDEHEQAERPPAEPEASETTEPMRRAR